MSFRYPPYNIADLSKLRAPTKVPFKKGETMSEQKIGGASYWEYMLTSLVTAVGVAVFVEWLRRWTTWLTSSEAHWEFAHQRKGRRGEFARSLILPSGDYDPLFCFSHIGWNCFETLLRIIMLHQAKSFFCAFRCVWVFSTGGTSFYSINFSNHNSRKQLHTYRSQYFQKSNQDLHNLNKRKPGQQSPTPLSKLFQPSISPFSFLISLTSILSNPRVGHAAFCQQINAT